MTDFVWLKRLRQCRWLIRHVVFCTALLSIGMVDESGGTEISHGPLIGHVGPDKAIIWARADGPGTYLLRYYPESSPNSVRKTVAMASGDQDFTMTWSISGLNPNERYRYEIQSPTGKNTNAPEQRFRTPATNEQQVKLAFGSCAWDVSHPRQPVWTSMATRQVDALFLLGDTPYIDSTELSVQRRRYQDFWSISELKSLIRHTPVCAVWDDHDFGPDNALGLIPGKEGSRKAFLEYHANPSYGQNDQGIYTRVRRGPVEVFLLDTRWFANTEASPFYNERKTLIGQQQWTWLQQALKDSNAPIKILACGMIWNEAAYPGKVDYWMAYPYEREGLFQFLRQAKIQGVILIGGDIHRSRHLIHPTAQRVGYDLHELIASPLAEKPAPDNNIPSPYLRYDAELHNSYLELDVNQDKDQLTVKAQFISNGDVQYHVDIQGSDLRSK